jgi:cell division ATPase FtsA
MFSFFRKMQKTERVLVIHIGSGSVMSTLVSSDGSKTTMHASASVDIPILSDLTLSQFEKETRKALDKALHTIASVRLSPPDRVAVYFASPWYASQVRTAKMSRPTSFVVTKALVDDMIARELKAFEDEQIADKKGTAEALRAVDAKVVQVKLNEYPHNDPIGMSTRELELSIYVSVAPEHIVKAIEETIQRTYHAPVTFSSFLLASFVVTRDFFPQVHSYVLVDVGGEVSDVTLVREGTIFQSVSFPHGCNFVLRKLSMGLNRSTAEAVSICTLYIDNKLEDTVRSQCDNILKEVKSIWSQSFQKALYTVSNDLSIPDTILLSVGTNIAPWFIDNIRHEEFHQYTRVEKDFKVIVLNSELFHDLLSFDPFVERNPFTMIETLHAVANNKK